MTVTRERRKRALDVRLQKRATHNRNGQHTTHNVRVHAKVTGGLAQRPAQLPSEAVHAGVCDGFHRLVVGLENDLKKGGG